MSVKKKIVQLKLIALRWTVKKYFTSIHQFIKKIQSFFIFIFPACFILMVKMVMLIHGFTCQLNAEFLEYLDIHI